MQATADVRWSASLDEDARGGTAAWIVTSEQCRTQVGSDLEPSAVDRGDVGARRGVEAERFLHRRLTLRWLVARWRGMPAAQVRIGYDDAGRPAVRHPRSGPFCSVTARGDIVGFALSTHPVGIDLEPDVSGPIAWAALSCDETAELTRLPESDRSAAFLELWTVKEAYLKALGTGLLRDPSALTVRRRDGLIGDGSQGVRLSSTAMRHDRSRETPVIAACIALSP